jgi:predicted RNA-binding protein with TRAM domain
MKRGGRREKGEKREREVERMGEEGEGMNELEGDWGRG